MPGSKIWEPSTHGGSHIASLPRKTDVGVMQCGQQPCLMAHTPSPTPEAARCQLLLRAGQPRYIMIHNDIMDNISYFLCFDICNYMSWYIRSFSVLPSQILFIFSSTLVLTSSIDVVFILSILYLTVTARKLPSKLQCQEMINIT